MKTLIIERFKEILSVCVNSSNLRCRVLHPVRFKKNYYFCFLQTAGGMRQPWYETFGAI